MDKNIELAILGIVIVGLILNFVCLLSLPNAPTVIEKPVLAQSPYNDTAINTKIDALSKEILKDSNWATDAKALAQAELEKKSYKELFLSMSQDLNLSIEDKADISSVVITNTEVTGTDVEDKDATVNYELKVKYEDMDGDSKKSYIDVEYVIKDNEVEDFEFSLH